MNFTELRSLVHHATKNDRLLGVIPSMVNQALRYTQDMRSWSGMAITGSFPVVSGADRVTLPAAYKELQGGYNPLLVTTLDDAEATPWMVISKQEMGRLQRIGTATDERKAYIDYENGGTPVLVFGGPMLTDATVQMDYYQYFADLVASTDRNWLTDRLPMLILWKAIALTFGLEQDQQSQQNVLAYDAKFDKEFIRAAGTDAISQRRGRSFRMGGV